MKRRFRAGFLIAAVVGLAVPAGPAGAAGAAGAAVKNNSVVFYRQSGSPSGYRAMVTKGRYTGKGTSNFSSGWTAIAVSSDSAIFYSNPTGVAVTGTFTKGVFKQKHTYNLSTGWTSVVAGCNTVAFYRPNGMLVLGTLTKGAFTQVTSTEFGSGPTDAVLSCDTLLLYSYNDGQAFTVGVNDGKFDTNSSNYDIDTKWFPITATDDSVIFYNQSGTGAWGTLKNGQFAQTGSSGGFSAGITNIAGTSNSLMFYTVGSATAGLATLKNGAYHFVGSQPGIITNWQTIQGGK